jgi:hypothetical protein
MKNIYRQKWNSARSNGRSVNEVNEIEINSRNYALSKIALMFVLALSVIFGGSITDAFKIQNAWGDLINDDQMPKHARNWMLQMQGEGTKENPKIITTPVELARIATIVNFREKFLAKSVFGVAFNEETAFTDQDVYLKLGNNIDLAEYRGEWIDPRGVPQTHGWMPIGIFFYSFKAHFDGDNHIISNLKFNSSRNNAGSGLFGNIDSAEITNLILTNVNVKGNQNVGGLAGSAYNAKITNSYIVGNVTGSKYVGGLIGKNKQKCTIVKSFFSGYINQIPNETE